MLRLGLTPFSAGDPTVSSTNRRTFLKTTAAAASLAYVPNFVHADGNNQTLKIGLVGCGGRGSGAAAQALSADSNVKLWAVGDAFQDRMDGCLRQLGQNAAHAAKIDVPAERRFVGF